MLAALFGYFLGTLQVLLLDWVRRRRDHQQHLRLLRAEFRNAREYKKRFNFGSEEWLKDDTVPRPPRVSPYFESTIAATNFTLTDEHADDNSQEAFLSITSGLALLEQYSSNFLRITESIKTLPEGPERTRLTEEGIQYTRSYDATLDRTLFVIDASLKDLDRRLRVSGLLEQLRRSVFPLPPGANPPPLIEGDPRVAQWRAQQGAAESATNAPDLRTAAGNDDR